MDNKKSALAKVSRAIVWTLSALFILLPSCVLAYFLTVLRYTKVVSDEILERL